MTSFQVPPGTPLLTACAIVVHNAKALIALTELVRRSCARYIILLWLATYAWLGLPR